MINKNFIFTIFTKRNNYGNTWVFTITLFSGANIFYKTNYAFCVIKFKSP